MYHINLITQTMESIITKYPQCSLLCLSLIFTLSGLKVGAQDSPVNLRCFDKINPVGTEEQPYFGWYMNDTDDDEIQTAYLILVASAVDLLNESDADMWNSGMLNSGKQNFIYYDGEPLSAASKYYWKVKLWDKGGVESSFSDTATFETGLFANEDWSGAKWIKRDNTTNEDYTYYRKTISVEDKSVERATVYVTAVHDYELYLNEKLVGKGPSYHYPQYQYYNAIDITDEIEQGSENLFASLTHWYGGGQGRPKSERGFLLKAVIEYSDATEQIIGTDATWKQVQAEAWKTGQPTRNGEGIGYVDKIYSSNFIPDWNKFEFIDSDWSSSVEIGPHPVASFTGKLQANLTRLIEEEISPVSVNMLDENKYLIDLGKVYAGVPKIQLGGGEDGNTATIVGGFTLKSGGTVSTTTTQSTNMASYYVYNGDTAIFQPFVYLGMRYIQVNNAFNTLTSDNCKFISRHYELDPDRSDFQTSDLMLKKVWDLMKHSLVLGSQESFVDTPTREKGGFLGDSWSIGVPCMSIMGDRNMNRRILLEFLDSQDQYWPDGRLNAVYPNVDGARDIPDYTQMYLVWVWDYYMQTGDVEFLRDNYSKLKKVADYVDAYKNETTGLIHNLEGGGGSYLFGIVDWPDQMRYGYDMAVETRTVQDVYAYLDFKAIADIAAVIDNTADSALYGQKAEDMKTAINDLLINDDGMYVDGLNSDLSQSTHISQQANMFPMAVSIVPEESRDSVIARIEELKMRSGMVTLRMLPAAIGNAEDGTHLYNLYTNTEWDGWAKTISLGGTATWEAWDANTNDQSLSHPWGAVGLLGMKEHFLGVKALKPQHELVQIKPLDFKYRLKDVSGTLPTDRGDIEVSWVRSDNLFTLDLAIPDNMKAQVYVPMCGMPGTTVTVNGESTEGTQEGDFIYLGEFGSGAHTFTRDAEIIELSSDCSASINADIGSLVQVNDESYTLDIVRGDAAIINFNVTTTHDGARASGDKVFDISGMAVDSSGIASITVTAEDGTTECVYTVTVNILPSSECAASFRVDVGRLRKVDNENYYIDLNEDEATVLNFTVTPRNDGASVSGDTVFDISGIAAGSFANAILTITAEDGTTECNYTIKVNILVGFESNILKRVTISPNPVHSILNVSNIENARISIYELKGILLERIDAVSNTVEIDVNRLSHGIYFLKIQMNEGVKIARFIKE